MGKVELKQQQKDPFDTDMALLSKLSPECQSYTVKIVTEREFFVDLEKEHVIGKPEVDTLVKEHIELIKSYCVAPNEQLSATQLYEKRGALEKMTEEEVIYGPVEKPPLLHQWISLLQKSGRTMGQNAKQLWGYLFNLPSDIFSALFHRLFSEQWIEDYAQQKIPPSEREEWKRRARLVAERRFNKARAGTNQFVAMNTLFQRIVSYLSDFTDDTKDVLTHSKIYRFFRAFSSSVGDVIDSAKDVVKDKVEDTKEFVGDVKEAIKNKLSDAYDSVKQNVRELNRDMERRKEEIETRAHDDYESLKHRAHDIKESLHDVKEKAKDKWQEEVKEPAQKKIEDWIDEAQLLLDESLGTYHHHDTRTDTLNEQPTRTRGRWFEKMKNTFYGGANRLKTLFTPREQQLSHVHHHHRPVGTEPVVNEKIETIVPSKEWKTLDIFLMVFVLPFLLLLPLLLGRQALFGSRAKLAREPVETDIPEVDEALLQAEELGVRLEAKIDRNRSELLQVKEEMRMDLNSIQIELDFLRKNTMNVDEIRQDVSVMRRSIGEAFGKIYKDFSSLSTPANIISSTTTTTATVTSPGLGERSRDKVYSEEYIQTSKVSSS